MKKVILLSFTLLMMSCLVSNAQTTTKNTKSAAVDKVEAYYFHLSARCITCQAVEAEAKKDLEALYGGKVSFKSINLEEDASKALAEKLKISGQTLLLVKGETKVNITNEGFMYARTNPVKFKSIIKEKVDKLSEL